MGLRLARVARLMSALPELLAMIKGVRTAFKAVGSALLLLLILVYVFSIMVFVLLRDDIEVAKDKNGYLFGKDYFGTLSLTMWTLLVDGAFMEDYGTLTRKLIDSDLWAAFVVFLIFLLGSALTVMNMLIGVLCAVVNTVAETEKDKLEIRLLKGTLLVLLKSLDTSGDGKISWDELEQLLNDEASSKVLESLEVKPAYLMDYGEMFFEDSETGELDLADIMDLILMLRGS